ncbi:Asp-tRNA(Asn)/Glu-tRNA(Gln) amidotransferase GatCAB subunit B [Candidatus Woesearchaeota archaeon]|nr:Asp-tRNA(Asn)/Glu-tRNA(Gln) amidotransferase GatCAB subunit B [Candidatus Woesearchaeota archaeon]
MEFKSDIVIGLECHVQLNTASKLFCSCPSQEEGQSNTKCCPTCLGMPGSKPVVNKKAIDFGIKLSLATNSKIAKELIFSRKSYFYPDMAKDFQISQYEIPLSTEGSMKLKSGKEVNLKRIHMEEDPAALVHTGSIQSSPYVLVDYNRSGNPLLEIVTEPELESPEEARDFMNRLITVLQYLEIFNLDSCIVKADANISLKESGYQRVEVKNITGFKEIERALFYEVERQKQELKEGKKIVQETRAWDSAKGTTFSLRTKETEEDYGYTIETDLVPIELTKGWLDEVRETLPELAQEKVKKFISKHKINKVDAEVIAQERLLAELFEKVAAEINPELAAKWLRRELMRVLHYNKKELHQLEIDETHLIDLLGLVESKQITDNVAKKLLEKLVEKPFDVKEYVKKEKLGKLSDSGEIEKICLETIKENPQAVEDYKNGEAKALNFIVGQVMRKTQGKADAEMVRRIVGDNISS